LLFDNQNRWLATILVSPAPEGEIRGPGVEAPFATSLDILFQAGFGSGFPIHQAFGKGFEARISGRFQQADRILFSEWQLLF
jgi:hypothetical protein